MKKSRHQERIITQLQFAEVFCCVYGNAMTLPTIKAGIPATGMMLCEPDVLPAELYAASAESETVLPVNDEICRAAEKAKLSVAAASSSSTNT
jgi:hypothetical protein